MYYDRGNHHEFTSLVKELARPGEMLQNTSFNFEFLNVEKPYETYTGSNVRLRYSIIVNQVIIFFNIKVYIIVYFVFRYFLRVTVVRRIYDIVKEMDIIVHTLSSYPDMNNSIKMEVGIEDCLHIEFEYNKCKYVNYLSIIILTSFYNLIY